MNGVSTQLASSPHLEWAGLRAHLTRCLTRRGPCIKQDFNFLFLSRLSYLDSTHFLSFRIPTHLKGNSLTLRCPKCTTGSGKESNFLRNWSRALQLVPVVPEFVHLKGPTRPTWVKHVPPLAEPLITRNEIAHCARRLLRPRSLIAGRSVCLLDSRW